MTPSVRVRGFVVAAAVCALLQVVVAGGFGAALLARADSSVPEPSVAAPPRAEEPLPSLPDPDPSPTPETDYAAPRDDRPVVRLRFEVADDLQSVTGSETVIFTPDLRVCELVFRLWPNKPETAAAGNDLSVTAATVDGAEVTPVVEAAGAPQGSTGTLLELPVEGCAEPGQPVTAELEFALVLGEGTPERVGWSAEAGMAWFGTAFPLLAWEHGVGWMREPAVDLFGEMAGSETFALELLEVVAPEGLEVMGTGQRGGTAGGAGPGLTVHAFSARAVRDVAVVVGELEVVEADVDGTRLHAAVPAGVETVTGVQEWLERQAESLRQVTAYLGPYPYTDLWVTVVPDFPTGVEFPGAVFYGDVDPAGYVALVPHETAHMWVYGLVGNNQGRDPWLDEGLTSYVEGHVLELDVLSQLKGVPPQGEGYLGASMTFWAERDADSGGRVYGASVYDQGARAFALARESAGGEAFDAALRAYLAEQAHQIATPADLADAFAPVPDALAVLTDAGAFAGDQGDP